MTDTTTADPDATPQPRPAGRSTSVLPRLVALLLVGAVMAPRPAAAQERGGFDLRRAMLGGGLGILSGLVMAGPSGDAVPTDDDGTAVILGGVVGVAASFLPFPEGTRVRGLAGPGFYRMGELGDLYEEIAGDVQNFQGSDEPGLGIESSVQVDIPVGDAGWGWGFQVGVANDAASVTIRQPTASGNVTREIASSTAQTLLVGLQGIRRFGGVQGPVALKAVVGGGYGGLATEGTTQAEVAPWGEVTIEAGGFIDGGGPTFQAGGRWHVVSDLDYDPIGPDASGVGEADFSGFFIRMGWTW